MAWSDINPNKIVTQSDVSTSGITGSFTASQPLRWMTKNTLTSSGLNYNRYNAFLVNKSSTQFLSKKDVEQSISSGSIFLDCFIGVNSPPINTGLVKDIKIQIESSYPSNSISSYTGRPVTHDTDILSRRRLPADSNASNCYLLGPLSESFGGGSYFYRFAINLVKLKTDYPSETRFTIGIYQKGLVADSSDVSKEARVTSSLKASQVIDVSPSGGVDFSSAMPENITNQTSYWTTSSVGVYDWKKISDIVFYVGPEYYTISQL